MIGKREVDGTEYEWNGFCLVWQAGLNVVPLAKEPTDDEIRFILAGWHPGYASGQNAGRRILQNEFRNLMDCQPR